MVDNRPGHPEEYTAEQPINLRQQKLRARDPEPVAAEPEPGAGGEAIPDPYGVGQRQLATAGAYDPHAWARDREEFLRSAPGPETDPATWGKRGRINALLGAKLPPKSDSDEVAHRRAVQRITQPLPGTPLVVVANPKGGQGKTPTTLMLSNTFGTHLGGGVVAWDNDSRGTLAMRAAIGGGDQRTVADLLANAHHLCSPNAVAGSFGAFLQRQPTKDDVLASERSRRRIPIGWDECAAVMAVLRRYRNLVVVDTGKDDTAESWHWAVQHADQLVIPLTYRRECAAGVVEMLADLRADGLEHLVEQAIVVLDAGSTGRDQKRRLDIEEELRKAGIAEHNLVHVPHVAALSDGDRIVYDRLPTAVVLAYTELTAKVADGLAAARFGRELELDAGALPAAREQPAPPRRPTPRPRAVSPPLSAQPPAPTPPRHWVTTRTNPSNGDRRRRGAG